MIRCPCASCHAKLGVGSFADGIELKARSMISCRLDRMGSRVATVLILRFRNVDCETSSEVKLLLLLLLPTF